MWIRPRWYVNEARSEDFATWIQQQADVHISTLTAVEMRCLLARRRRNQELTPTLERRAFAAFQDDVERGFLVQHRVDDKAVNGRLHLLELLSDPRLRTLDALHLSIARQLGLGRVATADAVMCNAAQALGLELVRFD
jgi:predicted nucleic acid-binding protein